MIVCLKKIFLILITITIFSCKTEEIIQNKSEEFIPLNCSLVVKFHDYSKWQKNLLLQQFLKLNADQYFLQFWSLEHWDLLIDLPQSFIITYNNLKKNKPIETIIFDKQDSLKLKLDIKQNYLYDGIGISNYELEKKSYYLANINNKTVVSQSKIILENIIRNFKSNIKAPKEVHKLLNTLSTNSPSLVINTTLFKEVSNNFFDDKFAKKYLQLSEFIGFDLIIDQNKILFSGLSFEPKNNNTNWLKLKNVKTEKSEIAELIPSNFVYTSSIQYADYFTFISADKTIGRNSDSDSIWLNTKEIATIQLPSGQANAIISKDINQTFKTLIHKASPFKEFAGNQIYKLNSPLLLEKDFTPIIQQQKLTYFIAYKNSIVSSNTPEILENIIININNKNVLSLQNNYKNYINSLTEKSHVLWISNLKQQTIFKGDKSNAKQKIQWDNNDLLFSQLTIEKDFAFLNILQQENQEVEDKTKVKQVIRLKTDTNLVIMPQFFKNWRTGQIDVVYQDAENVLHLQDTKGNLIWSKKLDSPIQGKINTIDIYQNKRLQLAFTTQNSVYILDKNGKDVIPFPKEFSDKISQALSVFDYDNNGNYRFVVVMGNKIKMYDKQGKVVSGFRFGETKTEVGFPIKHIRMQNKDYILVQEKSGKLHILNRVGSSRVELNDEFKHSNYPWYAHKNQFTSLSKNNKILKISPNGTITRDAKDWINPKIDIHDKYFIYMSENKLHINNKEVKLPYGVYTRPELIGDYIGISDTQTQKVYVLDTKGKIIDGFPAYGSSIIDTYVQKNKILLLCKEESQNFIVYEVKVEN